MTAARSAGCCLGASRTRPLLQEGLATTRVPVNAIQERPGILRFLLACAPTVPAAWDWVRRIPDHAWTAEAVGVVMDHARLLDEFVWCHAFRPGFPALVRQMLLDDSRYQRREWQPVLRLSTRTAWMGVGRRTSLSQSVLSIMVNTIPVLAHGVEAVLDLHVFHGPTPLVWQWWYAAHARDDLVLRERERDGVVRTWVADHVLRYVEAHGGCGVLSSAAAHRLLAELSGTADGCMAFAALALLAHFGGPGQWNEACANVLPLWNTVLLPHADRLASVLALADRRVRECEATPAMLALCGLVRALTPDAEVGAYDPPPDPDYGVMLAVMNTSCARHLLSHTAQFGRLSFWANALMCSSAAVPIWLGNGSAVIHEDCMGALGAAVHRLAENGTEDPLVLRALTEAFAYVHNKYTRLQETEVWGNLIDSDLGGLLRDLVAVFRRHYPLSFNLWPVLADVHARVATPPRWR